MFQIYMKYDPRKYTTDAYGNIRFDFLFSDWMMIWFVCYYFLPTNLSRNSPLTRFFVAEFNPLLAFILGAVENILTLIYIFIQTQNIKMSLKYLLMLSFAKILPIYLLWDAPFNVIRSSVVLCIVFGMYNVYLLINGTNIVQVYERTITSILEDKNQTPIYSFVSTVIYRTKWLIRRFQ